MATNSLGKIDLSRFRDENDKRIHKPKDDKPLSRQEELDLYRKEKEKLEEFLVDKPRPCVHFILDPDILSAHPDTIDVIRGIHGYHTQRSTHIDIIASQSFLSVVDTIDTDIKASISRGRLRYEPATDNLGLDATIDPYQLVSIAKRYEFDGLGAYIITERVGVKEAARQYHTNVLSYDALVRWLAPIKAYRQNLAAYRSGDPIYEGNIDWGMLLPEHRYRLLDYAGYKAIDLSPEDHYRDSEYWWLYHEEDATVMAPAPATTSDPEEQSAPEQEFSYSIPPGFSKSKIEGNDEEHFKLVSELGDDSVLQQVLDVILCAGHLDPTEQTIQLFLYKLSGRKRPDGESLPKIEWAGDPKALYYIIRSTTTSIRNKYKRMEQLFQVAHSKNPAQDADNADKTFRDELHKISRAFTLKEHR